MVPPDTQNTVGVCNQITFLILTLSILVLVTLSEVTDAPKQVPDIFYLSVSFKFLDFSFQIFLLFVSEMSASFTSNIDWIIYIALAWFLYPLHFSMFSFIQIPNILIQNMLYAASIHAELDYLAGVLICFLMFSQALFMSSPSV
jgi:hypothetical protein